MTRIKLTALHFGQIDERSTPLESLRELVRLSTILERVGYTRLWIGEHHSSRVAFSSPAVMLAALGAQTTTLRIGVAGVLLRLHAPLLVAEEYKLLSSLFPNRIDLGIARGTVDEKRRALLTSGTEEDFRARFKELISLMNESASVSASPWAAPPTELWGLGSGIETATICAEYGIAFCFAHFFMSDEAVMLEAVQRYRDGFRPSERLSAPHVAVAVAGTSSLDLGAEPKNTPIRVRHVTRGTPERHWEKINRLAGLLDVCDFAYLDLSANADERLHGYKALAALHNRLLEQNETLPERVAVP